jgi:uncharacterized protein (TIGR02391 family)
MSIKAKQIIPPFSGPHLEAIAKILGDTNEGLTGSEIGHKLQQCKIPDCDPSNTKWKRLYNALAEFQNRHGVGNHVIVLINETMNPASYTESPDIFRSRRDKLNAVLALNGFMLSEDGKIRRTEKANTLDEALERANRMQEQLRRRNAHAEVIRFCKAEIIANNNFHAVLEAMKSIASRIRSLSNLTSDGANLVKDAFGLGQTDSPLLAINPLDTETLRGEQRGFVNMLVGLFGMVRNPVAHEPKIEWPMEEIDALDILTMISFVHRKLDMAYKYGK